MLTRVVVCESKFPFVESSRRAPVDIWKSEINLSLSLPSHCRLNWVIICSIRICSRIVLRQAIESSDNHNSDDCCQLWEQNNSGLFNLFSFSFQALDNVLLLWMEISWHENALPIITTQISDSLTNTREMLRKESLPVGDIDVIVNGIEKQKVSEFRPTDEGFCYGKFKHTAAASFRVSEEEKSLFWRRWKCSTRDTNHRWTCCAYSNFPSSFPLRDKLSVVRRWKAEKVRALPAVCRAPSPFSLSFSHSTSTSHRKWAGPGTTGSTRSLELCEVSMTRAKKRRLSERDQKSIFDAIVRARNARERFNSDSTLLHVVHSVAFILFHGIGTRRHVQ